MNGHEAAVRLLVERGAEVDRASQVGVQCPSTRTPLDGLLLERGAEVGKASRPGFAPRSYGPRKLPRPAPRSSARTDQD